MKCKASISMKLL